MIGVSVIGITTGSGKSMDGISARMGYCSAGVILLAGAAAEGAAQNAAI